MRMHLPSLSLRKLVYRHLSEYYCNVDKKGIHKAITLLSRYYRVRRPKKIEWYEYLDRGKTWGEVDGTTGHFSLIAPEFWKASQREWILTFYHEWKHYLYWYDRERKADLYAAGMCKGC